MKKQLSFIPNKTILKYLLIIQFLLLGGSLLLYQSYKNENPVKPISKDNSAEIKRLSDIADVYFDTNKKDSAIYVFTKAKKLCDPNKNAIDYVYALSCIAELQLQQGNYIASEANATEALPYLKHIKNPRYSWIVYNLLGINYTDNYDSSNAIIYFKKAINLKTSAWRKYIALNNLAAVYMNQEKYKEAMDIFNILASQKNISKYDAINHNNYSFVINNLGFCYYKLGNQKKALNYFYEALKIRLKPETQEGLVTTYSYLSMYFEKTNPNLSREYAQKAYNHASKLNNATDEIGALGLLIKRSEGADLKRHSLSYLRLVDSVSIAKQTAKNQFTNIKYTSKKDKEENLKLKDQKAENKLQLERQKKRIIIAYIIIAFILGLVAFLYFHLKEKVKKEKDDAVFKSELRISQKLHDELANDVYQTMAFAENRDLKLTENKEHLLTNLENIYLRARNISKENSKITTNENYPAALKEMIAGFKTPKNNILLNGFDSVLWSKIEKNKKIVLYRVLQELFLNMKKHSQATLISITFKIIEKNIVVTYNDNGIGVNKNDLILKNGLQNVENRIKTINGTIIFDPDYEKGFKLSFTLPI
ncbi:tetratricopeptide repeat protein [Flavobacterium sp. 90]|uniref:tetratricopeptide repeat-containing sensor histidine kinase n=1 Tax=unclassified Flavobacterium TaxID=196869 RepID=UPI000EAD18DC|nr:MULTISPECIES: tetratricopeptide repeat-containing sensor histidine kinase [unclassified Flavobacterium]RKR11263.1 tetratricopeptide repeat protein [Flavobacterium sp. 81]TCK55044.1 tetratricopeptide repeat protein [Flavobacterium sp. 90]